MTTPHEDLVALIDATSGSDLSFGQKAGTVVEFVAGLATDRLLDLLVEAGFIPERYEHDSSDEKVYAKAMDALVAVALERLGYEAAVTDERGNAPDVIARCHDGTENSLALDAKAFRLSRTALNPKDYKIEALNTWRKDERYASLIGPIVGFPEGRSRLYDEAVKFDVTLLTFSHLRFLVEFGVSDCEPIEGVWRASEQLRSEEPTALTAPEYWRVIDLAVCEAASASLDDWKSARRAYLDALMRVADEQINYFEAQKTRLDDLPREALLGIALEALKIDTKVQQIRSKRDRAISLLAELDEAES